MTFLYIQVAGFIIVFLMWWLIAKYKCKDNVFWVISENKKRFFITVLIMIIAVTILCIKPLYNSSSCAFHGYITNTETQYSWFMGECQAKTVNGSFININRNRGLPDGKDADHYTIEE